MAKFFRKKGVLIIIKERKLEKRDKEKREANKSGLWVKKEDSWLQKYQMTHFQGPYV